MIREQIEIQVIAAVTAAACALLGVFLVLRRLALLSDAISHAILLGIVLAFFLVKSLASPLLLLGAAAAGVATVSLVELLHRSGRVREDAAIGLVFPALFSMGVILISRYAGNIHLDVDAVLMGELVYSVFYNRLHVLGVDVGPQVMYVMAAILLINLIFVLLFYKELKLATFDAALAATLGFAPALLHYALMTLVSITAVGAFDAVGSILVVALMIAPPAAAYLLADRLSHMLGLSVFLGVLSALAGYWLARPLDANLAGSMATACGLIFGLVFLFAPERGLIATARRRSRQRWDFAQTMLAIHLFNHEGKPEAETESRLDELHLHLRWDTRFLTRVVRLARQDGLVVDRAQHLQLTASGKELARQALLR